MEYVFAFPLITLPFLFLHCNFPILGDICKAFNSFSPSFNDQKGINEQWAEPVTWSSKIDAWGVKNLDIKSHLFPLAVTITPQDQDLFDQIFVCQFWYF